MNDFVYSAASRREFIRTLSVGVGASLVGASVLARPAAKPLGVALVGLGKYSMGQLAPALQQTKLCKLAGIVTGTPAKAAQWKRQYNIPEANIYNYQTFDRIADNPAIDIVYVVLPVGLHAEYVERAARAGKHVICEKPMATSAEDCRRMIAAMKKAGKKFSIGYRLHFEPHHQEMMRLGQTQALGPITHLAADNGFRFNNDTPWRVSKRLAGGGPLMDMGIYCVQGVIYTKGHLPVFVTAKFAPKTNPTLFKEVEEGLSWQMQFADGAVADCRTSYGQSLNSRLRAEAATGWLELQPSAFYYDGIEGRTSRGPMNLPNVPQQVATLESAVGDCELMNLPNVPQQARQLDDFAACIRNNQPTRVPGEMGLRDIELLTAIYRAAETGQKVSTKDVAAVLDKTNSR